MSGFKEKVLAAVATIPEGETRSYTEIATRAGNSRAARAVGAILCANKDTTVPCHRVIKSDGGLGGYNGLRGDKEKLLAHESAGRK